MPIILPRIPAAPTEGPLFPQQLEGVEYALSPRSQGNPAFLMEQRTGKCRTAIYWVKRLRPIVRTVIVVLPTDAVEGWETELRACRERFVRGYQLPQGKRLQAFLDLYDTPEGKRNWLIVNYESVVTLGERKVRQKVRADGERKEVSSRGVPDVAFLPWDVVIFDEVSKLRNPGSQTSKTALAGWRNVRHRAALTGLINPESLLDVYCPFAFLDGHFMGYTNFYQFRESLFRRNFWTKALPDWIPKTRDIGKQIKAAVHERAFVKTRKQAGIWVNKLPPETRSVPMNAKQKRIQAEILKDWAVQDAGLRTQYATVREMWLWYVAGGFDPNRELLSPEKANAIIEYLRGELAGQQSVIWFKFRHEVTYLYERLRDARIPVSFILGGMKPEEEREALDGCRAGKYRVLLATELSVRFGMDCSFTDVTQYYSNELSCEARAQSQERMAHLKKQGVPLAVIDWVSQGSTDEKVIQQVRSKHTTARMLMIDFRKWVGEELGQCKT